MICPCGFVLQGGASFCIECGRVISSPPSFMAKPIAHNSRFRLTVLLVGGVLLILSSLFTGVQQAANGWRLRSVGVSTFNTASPVDVRHFTSLLPVAGIAISLLALCALLSKQHVRFALSVSIVVVLTTLLGFQVAAYIASTHRNQLRNRIARLACDYCSPPFPTFAPTCYLVLSLLLVSMVVLAAFETKKAS